MSEYGIGVLRDKRQDGLYDPTDNRLHGGKITNPAKSRYRKYILVRWIDGDGDSYGHKQSEEMLPIVKELTMVWLCFVSRVIG